MRSDRTAAGQRGRKRGSRPQGRRGGRQFRRLPRRKKWCTAWILGARQSDLRLVAWRQRPVQSTFCLPSARLHCLATYVPFERRLVTQKRNWTKPPLTNQSSGSKPRLSIHFETITVGGQAVKPGLTADRIDFTRVNYGKQGHQQQKGGLRQPLCIIGYTISAIWRSYTNIFSCQQMVSSPTPCCSHLCRCFNWGPTARRIFFLGPWVKQEKKNILHNHV